MLTKLFGLEIVELNEKYFFQHLIKLFNLSIEQINKINIFASEKQGFKISLRDESEVEKFAKQNNLDTRNLIDIITVCDCIYERVEKRNPSREDLEKDFKIFEKKINIALNKNKLNALLDLFSRKPKYDLNKKVNIHEHGIIPCVYGVTFLHDIRAVFSDEDEGEIIKYIPVIITRISALDDNDKKVYFRFQFSEESIRSFKKYLDISIKNLEKIKKDLGKKLDMK